MPLLRKFLRLPAGDRALLMRTALMLGVARLALWFLPFGLARRLLTPASSIKPTTDAGLSPERIAWAIAHAHRVIPRANCLPQALAAESLLTRSGHPVELRIGVIKTKRGGLEAHAWVESEGRLVVGDLTQGLHGFTPLPPLPGARTSP